MAIIRVLPPGQAARAQGEAKHPAKAAEAEIEKHGSRHETTPSGAFK